MKNIFTLLCIVLSTGAFSQVKIGSSGIPDANAVLELDGGTSKGFLLPRITATDMNGAGFSAAPNGLLIYNSTDGFIYIRKAAAWQKVTDATNNGGFSLPYAGTASTLGGAEFSITHTTTFGDAAHFSNTAGAAGLAIGTYSGSNKLNMTGGNTGIGIPAGLSEFPGLGKLVVRGVVGSTSAVFGDKTSGVSIENNFPGIAFNAYQNSGSKNIIDGYSARIYHNPTTGFMYFSTASAAGTAGNANDANMVTRLTMKPDGNVGIGVVDPLMNLHVRGTDSALALIENTQALAVNVKSSIYLRTGSSYTGAIKTTGTSGIDARLGLFTYSSGLASQLKEQLSISDAGNVGIGNINPTSPLSFSNALGEKINFYEASASSNYGIGVQGAQMQLYTGSSNDAISFGYGSSAAFTEKVKMQYGYIVLNNGRIRFDKQYDAGNSSGIEFTRKTTSELRGFVGMLDDDNFGFYGYGGVGWGLLWDVRDGALKIGTTQKATGYLLNVGGKIMAEEVRVALRSNWPDYVFSKNYKLRSIKEVEKYIAVNNHLPNVPAAAEVEKSGIALGEMQTRMMEKIEELTLYIIELKKENIQMKKSIQQLKQQLPGKRN